MKSVLGLISLMLLWQSSFAQYGSVWYFGKNAGLDFKSSPPKALYDGKINQMEGCAVMCDASGNMLLYTDGQSLWNKKHNIVSNGLNLGGHQDATQSGIIVPKPGSTKLYYVFSVDYALNIGGLQYAIVDMSANGGDGLVTSKNNQLKTPITEKITAVKHSNGKDFWILTHEHKNNRFLAYLLSTTGLNTTPVTSDVGTPHVKSSGQGYLRVSQDSKTLAIADLIEYLIEIFAFDNATGKVSNPITLNGSDYNRVYGLEFSPDGKKLYASRLQQPSRIYQFDLSTMSTAAIVASRKLVYEVNIDYGLGALQLGPDGKIYANQRNGTSHSDFLAVIDKPNEISPNCLFKKDAVYLFPGGSQLGLPNVISSLLIHDSIEFSGICLGGSTLFWLSSNITYDSVIWNFGDPLNSISKISFPSFNYLAAGTYIVSVKVFFNSVSYDFSRQIDIREKPIVILPQDTILCENQTIQLNVSCAGCNYLWEDKSLSPLRTISSSGSYSVVVTNKESCSDSGKFDVFQFSNMIWNLGNDSTICDGDSVFLSAPVAAGLIWNDAVTCQTRYVKNKGLYKATITHMCGIVSDSIYLDVIPLPEFDLGKDTVLCKDSIYISDLSSYPYNFLWHDSILSSFRTFQKDTIVWVSATEKGCTAFDSLYIDRVKPIDWTWPSDTSICLGTQILVRLDDKYTSSVWSDGYIEATRIIAKPGYYRVDINSPCGNRSESINLSFHDCQCIINVPNAFTPTSDNLNETFGPIITCEVQNMTFNIYNRWGELIFTSNSLKDFWNGYYMGERVQNDTYLWKLDFLGKYAHTESLYHLKGLVHVLY